MDVSMTGWTGRIPESVSRWHLEAGQKELGVKVVGCDVVERVECSD